MSKEHRVFDLASKLAAVQRIEAGESVSKLHRELRISRSVLYRWLMAFRMGGKAGLERSVGRPLGGRYRPQEVSDAGQAADQRIAELERKVGQQELDLDFFHRAFKRLKEPRQNNLGVGVAASTE